MADNHTSSVARSGDWREERQDRRDREEPFFTRRSHTKSRTGCSSVTKMTIVEDDQLTISGHANHTESDVTSRSRLAKNVEREEENVGTCKWALQEASEESREQSRQSSSRRTKDDTRQCQPMPTFHHIPIILVIYIPRPLHFRTDRHRQDLQSDDPPASIGGQYHRRSHTSPWIIIRS